jgi:hypothetical protein
LVAVRPIVEIVSFARVGERVSILARENGRCRPFDLYRDNLACRAATPVDDLDFAVNAEILGLLPPDVAHVCH